MSKTTNKKKINLIERYFELQNTLKQLETEQKLLRSELLALLSESQGILLTDQLVAQVESCTRTSLDRTSLVQEMGEKWVKDRLKVTTYDKLTVKLKQDKRVA